MAYAAVSSAKQKIERLLHPSQSKILLPDAETKSLYAELCYLESVLQDHASMKVKKLRFDPLEEQIEDTADKVADLMESRVPLADESESGKGEISNNSDFIFSRQLLDIKQEIADLAEKASSELQSMEEEEHEAGNSYAVSSKIVHHSGELVGLDDELRQLMDWLTGGPDKLEIYSIHGMAGIGKTTLVQEAYNDPSIVSQFDTRIMVNIGPNFRLKEFVRAVLVHLGIVDKISEMDLKRFLEQKKYLIVLDNVWDNAVWFWLSQYFPRNSTKCRVILTTRLETVARRPNRTHFHGKRFFDDEESWDLLHKMVFTNSKESCSAELKEIGKKIAQNCEGLPLVVVSIAELLCQVEKTIENWEKVAEDDNPLKIGVDDSTPISKSLSLSYELLPQYLKTCFLYMGVFPQSYEIFVSELIRLWDVEGFLTLQNNKSIKDIVEVWLDDLISKTVVLVHERSSTSGKIKTCRIHSVFRNLCIGKARKEKFCHVIKKYAYSSPEDLNRQQRLCIHNHVMLAIKEAQNAMTSISSVRSLLCFGPYHQYPMRVYLSFKLLKILHALRIRFYTFPREILELVHLKYLAITYNGELPRSIHNLWNLEVLIVGRHHCIISPDAPTYLPLQIWNLKWLRHLQCLGFDLLESSTTLQHLVTLSGVSAHSCTEKVLAKMPNLNKLGVRIELAPGKEETFSFFGDIKKHLPDLQTFKCVVLGINSRVISQVPDFPSNIQKLTLSGCKFDWKCMTAICKLQNLKVLKLRCNAFHGATWVPSEEISCKLDILVLEDLNIKVWGAKYNHFPKLERLLIRHCYNLHKIPIDFENIETLKLIEVEDCNPSLGTSAEEIQGKHQQKYGQDYLKVQIHYSWDDKKNAKPRRL